MLDLTRYGVTAPVTAPHNFLLEAIPAFNARVRALKQDREAPAPISKRESEARASLLENVSPAAVSAVEKIGKILDGIKDADSLYVQENLRPYLTRLENSVSFAVWEATQDDSAEETPADETEDVGAELETWRTMIETAWSVANMVGEREALENLSRDILGKNEKIEDEEKHEFAPVRFVEETKDGKKTGKIVSKPNIVNIPGELSGKGKKNGREADSFYVGYVIQSGDDEPVTVPPKTHKVKLLAHYLPTVSAAEFDKAWKKNRAETKTGENVVMKFGDVVVTAVHPDNMPKEDDAKETD